MKQAADRLIHSGHFISAVRSAARTRLSESRYRRFESFTAGHFVLIVQPERTERYERSNRGSNPRRHARFGSSSNWTGHIPPKDDIPVRIRANRPCALVADGNATDCLSVQCGFESRPARQKVFVVFDKWPKSPLSQGGHHGFESHTPRQSLPLSTSGRVPCLSNR